MHVKTHKERKEKLQKKLARHAKRWDELPLYLRFPEQRPFLVNWSSFYKLVQHETISSHQVLFHIPTNEVSMSNMYTKKGPVLPIVVNAHMVIAELLESCKSFFFLRNMLSLFQLIEPQKRKRGHIFQNGAKRRQHAFAFKLCTPCLTY